MDMGGMSGMSGSNSSMMSMAMMTGFVSGPGSMLYSPNWMPTTTGTYAGTCIFLIILAALFRLGWAYKAACERKWWHTEMDRRVIIVRGKTDNNSDKDSTRGLLTVGPNGPQEDVRILSPGKSSIPPWRLSTDLPRALMVVVLSGVGYLLMLAVMTMNVGYFLSILAGIFVSELAVGRYGGNVAHA